jgi:hypothetical protein
MKRAALAEPDHIDPECMRVPEDGLVTQLGQDRAEHRV